MNAEQGRPTLAWHDEADRLATWGTLDPPDACMCTTCVLSPPGQNQTDHTTDGSGS